MKPSKLTGYFIWQLISLINSRLVLIYFMFWDWYTLKDKGFFKNKCVLCSEWNLARKTWWCKSLVTHAQQAFLGRCFSFLVREVKRRRHKGQREESHGKPWDVEVAKTLFSPAVLVFRVSNHSPYNFLVWPFKSIG